MPPLTSRFLVRFHGTPYQSQAFALQQKDGAYWSPHGRLTGIAKAATFQTEQVARLCLELWSARLKERWGEEFVAEVERCGRSRQAARTDEGGVMLLARGRSGRFAGNVPVEEAVLAAVRQELIQMFGWSF